MQKIRTLSDDDLRAMIREQDLTAYRERALRPESPVVRGTAHNPDTFFQAREASNAYYNDLPSAIVERSDAGGSRLVTGRGVSTSFDYVGHPEDADRVIVMMGSGVATEVEAVDRDGRRGSRARSESDSSKSVSTVLSRCRTLSSPQAARETTRSIAVLDRTKEPGARWESRCCLDVMCSDSTEGVADGIGAVRGAPQTSIGGERPVRTFQSKEFTPAMVKGDLRRAVEGARRQRRRFTVGIVDDVTGICLSTSDDGCRHRSRTKCVRAVFYGLGARTAR